MYLEVFATAALIFVARVVDVTFGTLRTSYVVRGKREFAFAFGFLEVLVWVWVVAKVIASLDHPIYYVAFALGFATGTVVGISVEGWFAVGDQVVRVFSPNPKTLVAALCERGLRCTEFPGNGSKRPRLSALYSGASAKDGFRNRDGTKDRSDLLLHRR